MVSFAISFKDKYFFYNLSSLPQYRNIVINFVDQSAVISFFRTMVLGNIPVGALEI